MDSFCIRPFAEDTLADAELVVRDGFGDDAVPQLNKVLTNPFREIGQSAGDIIYVNGEPVGFQAAILRVLYVGERRFNATVPGMLVVRKGTAPEDVLSLIEATIVDRNDRKLVIGNTGIPIAKKLFEFMGITGIGPDSCARIRFSPLRMGRFIRYCSHNRVPLAMARLLDGVVGLFCGITSNPDVEVLSSLTGSGLDAFWNLYLETNEGIVFSRTEVELEWMFAEEVKNGTALFLVQRDSHNQIVGYIVVKESISTPGRWMVVDWIADGNDRKVLHSLLSNAIRALRRIRKDAFLLESIGFPMDVQDVIGSCMRFSRKAKSNGVGFKAYDACIEEAMNSGRGWFFGPWDGDRCM